MDKEFIARLNKTFDGATMAEVARRLKIPHATVRNYYKEARLPAPEVLMKIAAESGVSLNWLLLGTGDMYGNQRPPISLGTFLEEKIGEIVDRKLAEQSSTGIQDIGVADGIAVFDVEAAVQEFDDPQRVMNEWFRHEGREYPQDYGIIFFRGWESFSREDKIEAVHDAKRVLDRSLSE
ncbi:MAG: helix-turn-helix domain-containing protein [Pyrinomonadaceae bacterium]